MSDSYESIFSYFLLFRGIKAQHFAICSNSKIFGVRGMVPFVQVGSIPPHDSSLLPIASSEIQGSRR